MQPTEPLSLTPPSLPSGGGAITGLKGDMAAAGPDGAATLSIPLPVSTGRGYAPAMSLSYHSRGGNGIFGAGWSCGQMAISLRTRNGVPLYDGGDTFTGPDGEVLVPALNADGTADVRTASALLGERLGGTFAVEAYRSRVETDFSRLERWVSQADATVDFWLLYSPDGQIHLLGRNAQARISNPDDASRTAVWLIESSVSVSGEQIYWQYRQEDDQGCTQDEKTAHANAVAQRYLVAVWYGNKTASRTLPALLTPPATASWLFTLVLDYGERGTGLATPPGWLAPGTGEWSCRQDAFSGWEYGFELRTRRLCRQVLMYHDIAALSGDLKAGDTPQQVACLMLDYNESPVMTTLQTVRQVAYEANGTPKSLPPLAFSWQTFTPPEQGIADWQPRNDMGQMNSLQPYQLVDLNGEGLAGILFQDAGAWWYRAPVRQTGDAPDAVTWGKATPLPAIPALREGGVLTDLNGDGWLEWVVTAPGVSGQYSRTTDGTWQRFAPLSALPVEYAHPRAQLADITGGGLPDLTLIGPKSVRFYCGTGDGWAKAQAVIQTTGITLPAVRADARVMVGFSDMAGSGQQHLVEVRADGVRYWPNCGRGRFGEPVSMAGFSQPAATFNPEQLYLADIDGSGTTDLIYALTDRLDVYINQSGNHFAAPFRLFLPDGIRYDNTCRLQVADIQGLGVSALVLSVPHPAPRHWVCHLTTQKPWLLSGMNNNMGARHVLHYRSSAQFWLDEKQAAEGREPACRLPFALHTLQRTEVTDEITGNRMVSTVRYRHGTWDGQEREFRGFGFVEVSDTDMTAHQEAGDDISLPAVSRSWYATGLPDIDVRLPDEYWKGDTAAFTGFTSRFTVGSGDEEAVLSGISGETLFWLNRGQKGILLRGELYGADGSIQADIPYSVTENRPQVRLVQADGIDPVVWPAIVESRTYQYERVSSDPQCSQRVLLSSDATGLPLKQVSVSYPRRSQPAASPYPDTLPEGLFAGSFNEQQTKLFLSMTQSNWHTMVNLISGEWLNGLADATRRDVFTHPASVVPSGGLSLEQLQQSNTLLSDDQPYVLAGQTQVWYLDIRHKATTGTPAFPPLQAFTESAVLDDDAFTALSGIITYSRLDLAGYTGTGYLFTRKHETYSKLWSVRQGYATYGGAGDFYLPQTTQQTLLTGKTTVTRDAYNCVVLQVQDAAGLTTTAEYDWRFLLPVRVTDASDNIHTCTFDALGRVTSLRSGGTENGATAGYSDADMVIPETVDEALALKAPLPVAQCHVYVPDSWMRDGAEKLPPHVLMLQTDRYDSDAGQQIRQQVVFSDGFGRVLQTGSRQADGDAWQRTDGGALMAGPDGSPATVQTAFRWVVSGRTEYDNKGQAVRTYQPYFLDSWRYVRDDSARQDLFADTHAYDPVGREKQVKTARGWLRRSLYTPWFVVSEDENDTAADAVGPV